MATSSDHTGEPQTSAAFPRGWAVFESRTAGHQSSVSPHHMQGYASRASVPESRPWSAPSSGRPTGQVQVGAGEPCAGRLYRCDAEHHCIDVIDDAGQPLFSFGGYGTGAGQFKMPTDVLLVPLGELNESPSDAPLAVVVADRDNHRLQIFELDGAFVGRIDPWLGRSRHVELVSRAGWPFFRVNPVPQLVLPSRLEWRHPYLDVISGDGHIVSLDLQLALLPDFETWLDEAPRSVAKAALDHFRRVPSSRTLPDTHLRAITSKVRAGLTLVEGARA